MLLGFYARVAAWAQGKNWYWRLPLLLLFGYFFFRHLTDPFYSSVIGALNLGIHELGHFVFGLLGEFMGVAGGTLFQILIPIAGMVNFSRQEDYFSVTLCFGWLSTNFFEISRYVADARVLELPLVTPFGGGTVVHDWNFMLAELGILDYNMQVASVIKSLAAASMVLCLAAGGWVIWLMARKAAGTTADEGRMS